MNLDSDAHSSQALKSLSAEIGFDSLKLEQDGEAGRLWDALNDLANDPIAYNSFIQKQLQHLESGKDGEVQLQQSAAAAVPPFVPLPAFVVKTFSHPDRTKSFLNICHHGTAVPGPIDEDGNVVDESCRNLENLQIPLLVSKPRECFDSSRNKAKAVDVVVNSWCNDACRKSAPFKTALVNLAISSLKEEHSIEVKTQGQAPWKILQSKYKGGLGKDGAGPRPFEDGQEPKKMKMEEVADSPSDLLKFREVQKEQIHSKDRGLDMPPTNKTKKGCNGLIQEISSDSPSSAVFTATKKESSKGSTSKQRHAIKPGFLNQRSGKKSLYSADGSAGDGSSGVGGSYVKLMSKYKVVDTNDHPSKASFDTEADTCMGKDPEASAGQDIAQTLNDLSNVMASTLLGNEQDKGSMWGDVAPSDISKKTDVDQGSSNAKNVTTTRNGRQITLQFDLTSCQEKINSIRDLDLQMSETSIVLVAPQCNEQWSATFPHHMDVGSVSAKFRRKQQMLEVMCLQK